MKIPYSINPGRHRALEFLLSRYSPWPLAAPVPSDEELPWSSPPHFARLIMVACSPGASHWCARTRWLRLVRPTRRSP